MGDRALVLFFDRDRVSPSVYLHWHGSSVPAWIAELARLMSDRRGDASYAAARFTGLCHTQIAGNLSLGITSYPLTLRHVTDVAVLEEMSPGNAGVVVVNTLDFSWQAYGGYLADHQPTNLRETDQ